MIGSYFIIHRHMSKSKTGIEIQDMIDEVMSMAGVDNMELKSTITFIDASGMQHLYFIFIER